MTVTDPLQTGALDRAKRQQILDGARRCFLEQGFDAASMNDIVKAAGVSKGTVYAYFPSKEKLFETLIAEDRRRQVEQTIVIEAPHGPIEATLYDLGLRLARQTTAEETIAYSRMVMGVVAKFPEIGRSYYEAGPVYAIVKIAEFLKARMADGTLVAGDPLLAAQQFTDLVLCGLLKPKLFACEDLLPPAAPETVVRHGVAMFLAAMRKPV